MAVADGLLPSPGCPSWLVGLWGPKTSFKSVSASAPAFTVDAVPIPPGGALNPILNWIGWPASMLVGLGSCGLALKPSVSRGLWLFP